MREGAVIADRFEVEALVGVGGMGSVFRARDRHEGSRVAIKVLKERTETASARFLLEARVLAELRHPGIVRYISHGATVGGDHYLAMEWLEGTSLADRLDQGLLSVAEAIVLATRVADALAFAHERGVIHRDVKPSNIFLVDGAADRVKVLDFGVARLGRGSGENTRHGARIGTPRYMAPEQVRGDPDLDARVDVFALGCVLYNCLSGRPAFAGDDEMAVMAKILLEDPPSVTDARPGVPAPLAKLVGRMLAKDPIVRPSDCSTIAAELADLSGADSTVVLTQRDREQRPAGAELRILSVVLVQRDHEAILDRTTVDAMRDAAAQHGARLETLADGNMVATMMAARSATDQAAQAGRLAMALGRLYPRGRVALATGRGLVAARLPMGEAIDRAAALLRGGPGAGVIVDVVSAGLLDARFDVRREDRGLILIGERERVAARTLLGRPTPCVGRERELGMLSAIFEECADEGVARVVLVTAPPGVGKSRLRYELLRRVHETRPDVQVLFGRGDPMRAGSPFGLIAPAIRSAAGVLDGESATAQMAKMRELVARLAPAERERVAQFLGELVGVRFPDGASVQLAAAHGDAILMGDQMRRAWEDFLAAECSAHPVILVLEDLHWGDLPSVKFVDAALRNLAGAPLMVLALARPDVHGMFPSLWAERSLTEMRLGELSKKAGERLVKAVLGDAAPPELSARLVERAAGNALYLEELIRAVASGASGETLPDTVLAMVLARLESFSTEARRLLRAGAVFGEVFWSGGLAAVILGASPLVGRSPTSLPGDQIGTREIGEWLAVLVEREVISRRVTAKFPGEEEYVFRHGLVRDAAYSMWDEPERAEAHRRAGGWLETHGELDAMVLAEHLKNGGEPERAIAWYRRAAGQALEGNDFAAAITRAETALDLAPPDARERGELLVVVAEAKKWLGANADGMRAAREALRSIPRGKPSWCVAAGELVVTAAKIGDQAAMTELAAELAAAAAEAKEEMMPLSGPLLTAVARTVASLLLLGHEAGLSLFAHLELDEARRQALPPSVIARVEMARGVRLMMTGNVDEFLRRSKACVSWYEQAGDFRGALGPRANLGFALIELGAYAEAEQVLGDALAVSRRLGLTSVTGGALQNLGWALARQGKLDEALAVETQAVDAFHAQGARYYEGGARIYLGRIFAARGDARRAEEELGRAIELLAISPPLRCFALGTLADLLRAAGRIDEALARATEAMETLRAAGEVNEGDSLVRLAYARALGAAGKSEEAAEALRLARVRLGERAEKIADPALRERFLGVEENAATMMD